MIRMKYVLQSMNVFNGILAIAAAVAVYFTVIPYWDPGVQISLPPVKGTMAETYTLSPLPQNTSQADYAVIGDQNLFHPERKIPPEKKEAQAVPKPEIILYGTLITDRMSVAFIEDKKAPRTTPGRGKRQVTLHKGEQVNGYTLRDIEVNRIVLVKGEDTMVVLLESGEKRKNIDMQAQAGGMIPGSTQTAAATASMPMQSPVQKATQAAAPLPANAAAPGKTAGQDTSTPRPSSRSAMLEEVKRLKAERQSGAP